MPNTTDSGVPPTRSANARRALWTAVAVRRERAELAPGWAGALRRVAMIARMTDSGCNAHSGPSR